MAVFLYIARPRHGKSTLLRKHVYEQRSDVRAFLILDRDGKSTWQGPVFTSTAELRRRDTIPKWCVFRGVSGAEVAELAVDLGDCVIVDEEVHRTIAERPWKTWDPRRRVDAKGKPIGHPLFAVLHEGAHIENALGQASTVSALIATHRPSNLPKDLPALCDGIYLGALSAYVDADRCYREGWVPEADGPRRARELLAARRVGEFSFIPNNS